MEWKITNCPILNWYQWNENCLKWIRYEQKMVLKCIENDQFLTVIPRKEAPFSQWYYSDANPYLIIQ